MNLLRRLLPRPLRRWLVRLTRWPPVGRVDWGGLRRLEPVSRSWGGDRGQAVDRYYIERFLAGAEGDVRGRVLEVGHDAYTRQFGGERVEKAEVVHAEPGNPRADWVADFADAPHLPTDAFDCIVCTQTLNCVPEVEAAVRTLHRILKPGGVLLVTVPGISRNYVPEDGGWDDHWRFTRHGASWLFRRVFGDDAVTVESYGNLPASVAFLQGLAAEELTGEELDHRDPLYEMLIAVRAVKR